MKKKKRDKTLLHNKQEVNPIDIEFPLNLSFLRDENRIFQNLSDSDLFYGICFLFFFPDILKALV